jgi:hypothetical protein
MEKYPKITDVRPQKDKRLLVTFSNGIEKIYDCSPLLDHDVFKPLMNDTLFNPEWKSWSSGPVEDPAIGGQR